MCFELKGAAGSYLQVARNGVEQQVYLLGTIYECDWQLNADGKFDGDSGEVEADWNRCMDICKGDWWAILQADDDQLAVCVVFADNADAEAFKASWGMGA